MPGTTNVAGIEVSYSATTARIVERANAEDVDLDGTFAVDFHVGKLLAYEYVLAYLGAGWFWSQVNEPAAIKVPDLSGYKLKAGFRFDILPGGFFSTLEGQLFLAKGEDTGLGKLDVSEGRVLLKIGHKF